MITVQDLEPLLFAGGDVVGGDGKKIGTVGQLFLDARTGNPAWVTVRTGMFGKAESFLPMVGAELHGNELHVPHSKDAVKHAPRIESADGHLSPDEERDLYRHYGLLHDDVPDAVDAHEVREIAEAGEVSEAREVPVARGAHEAHDAHDGARGTGSHDVVPGAEGADTASGVGAAGLATVAAGPVPTNAPAPVAPTSPGPPPQTSYGDARADATARSERGSDERVGPTDEGTTSSAAPGAGTRSVVPDADAPSAGGATAASSLAGPAPAQDAARLGTADGGTDAADGMVLSAEQARVVGTEQVPSERVRMRRYTVTEQKQVTVPVQREEVRVEYEPVDDDADDAARTTGDDPRTGGGTEPSGPGHVRPDDSRT